MLGIHGTLGEKIYLRSPCLSVLWLYRQSFVHLDAMADFVSSVFASCIIMYLFILTLLRRLWFTYITYMHT